MAVAADISALTDELIAAIAGTTSRFKRLKSRAEATLKAKALGRTDQFAVAKQLEGLQEKLQVFNKDELANALRIRLHELDKQDNRWSPEILSLLIQLSDRPATLSRVDSIELTKPPEPPRPLTWSDLDASGAAYCDDNIWEEVDFAAESSDDDLSTVSSDVSIPRILPQSFKAPQDDFVVAEELFSTGDDEELIAAIKSAQFWDGDNRNADQGGKDYSHFITELQVVRETIFMLQGLPTSLFWRLDYSIEVDRRYGLRHSSSQALFTLLRSFSSIGAKIDALRRFAKTPQSVLYLQTFHRGVEECLCRFDVCLSQMQSEYLSQSQVTAVSLLRLFEDVRRESRLLLLLADLLAKSEADLSNEPFKCLDYLYNLVCTSQAAGDDEDFRYLAKLFFSCFETYIRPMRLWMETGQLDTAQGTFFVSDTRKDNDLRTLWHDWYTLDETAGRLHAPRFLKPAAHKVFTTGKSMIFLRHLNIAPESLDSLEKTSLTFEDICPGEPSSLLLPFSGLLETAFDRLIDANHTITSNLLREQLDQKCGLWISLEALEYIYLCRDMSIYSVIDNKIFELIDRGRGAWNDRFLLTELAQSVLGDLPCVDSSRLIVRSSRGPYRDVNNRSRSVKILRTLSIDYVLPWPVANIITKDAIQTYQRISTFLMQIRRAKYVLEKQRLRKGSGPDAEFEDDEDDALGYGIRHNLLWFINTLYNHLTELVIEITTVSMLKSLSAAKDVDDMITVHRSYMSSLEDQCLLSKSLAPIYQAIIGLLDLCVHFGDIQASRYAENQFDLTNRSFGASINRGYSQFSRSQLRRREEASASEEDDDDDDDDDDEGDFDGNNTAAISFLESPYAHRLRNLKEQFERLVAFVAAGLRGVGRVDGQQSWEILAEKLEWRKARFQLN
ncbi:hypothetical protein VTN00DRAFT_6496 [Thermoascus crustaceus]|uniref:uncharacterized protein n=1 Tax=Thermoascus crustaceus TaxID=5088 RepID=UPI003742F8AA